MKHGARDYWAAQGITIATMKYHACLAWPIYPSLRLTPVCFTSARER